MSVMNCPHCGEQIDTDFDVEHIEICGESALEDVLVDILVDTVDILVKRGLIDRKKHIEESDKLQKLIDAEYAKDDSIKDIQSLGNWESQLAYIKNSVMSYTAEYDKLLNRQKEILRDLKANREARIKRIEDSKTSWAGLMRALEEEELKERLGDDMELMRIAKNKRRDELAEWHIYTDGKADQPLLNADTVKDDNE